METGNSPCPDKDPQPQSSSNPHNFESLLLERFNQTDKKIRFLSYAGGGGAGHVFGVRIADKQYALKMFKFDHPELNVSRLRGMKRRYLLDPFFIECRANGSLIQQGLNGQITPFCYGWVKIPARAEIHLSRKFEIHPFTWNRPPSAADQDIPGILFEWIDGHPLWRIRPSRDIADQIRAKLKALHGAQVAHGDLRASNILVQSLESKAYLVDLSASITHPHIRFSLEKIQENQRDEAQGLETGLALLSQIPVNKSLSVSNLSSSDEESLERLFAESEYIKHLWAPPQPTCWQPPTVEPCSAVCDF
ncbi:hypothetical protein AYO21_01495 [Fonsecaea monophora]|uniref:Protein kinase domain-containing protein n=1 Tax=Fonsecaea monophora TaxID=254056 RepID=A0A177FMW2_9EURO|nr:hypothetical protein AYO21_01495 [Fonsecaea monophora]OAG44499.1 hypothetical protein AYO21_01495 [Fonsecaea monophora]